MHPDTTFAPSFSLLSGCDRCPKWWYVPARTVTAAAGCGVLTPACAPACQFAPWHPQTNA
jgi:hypothetical protein